jgi:hypothetical protein
MMRWSWIRKVFMFAAGVAVLACVAEAQQRPVDHQELVTLFQEFVTLERPPNRKGAPDYTSATLEAKQRSLSSLQSRLAALDSAAWSTEHRVDHALLGALMNGLEFNLRVLKPWERDPAFYKSLWVKQSDTPAHEGPTHHALTELWTYSFPLSEADQLKLAAELNTIPPLLEQARSNLTGNARDLWVTGTGTLAEQVTELDALARRLPDASEVLKRAIGAARQASASFVTWLEQQAPQKTGPSGIGKEHYNWSLQKVHLVPLTWDDEVAILQRELARAHASLKIEEHRNRRLPALTAAATAEEFEARANAAVTKYMAFLKDQEIVTVQDYLDPALRERIGPFVPLERRNFFRIASHYEPITLFTHYYHWFDLAWMSRAPHASPIRRGATLFNIWDSRAEGMATAMEEIALHAGYFDDNPRAREIVWIMLAQRCARGLASLYAQANQFDMHEAKAFQVRWTPRGWMRPDLDLLGFEQQLYLRQPGYGTSYITGKHLIDELIKDRAEQLGDRFTLRGFLDEVNGAGMIPVPLIRLQLLGRNDGTVGK